MVAELVQAKEQSLNSPNPVSGAQGAESVSKVLGQIAERTMEKAQDYATEASKTNYLQTQSMLKDVEANSKLEMLKSPGHAQAIAKNAEQTAEQIKANASLNRQDRVNLDLAVKDLNRGLSFDAAQKSIAITNQSAKYATLSAFGNTLQSIKNEIFTNPENAQKLIEAQYASLAGQVKSGVITAVEGANLHKQLEKQVELAEHLLNGMNEGVLDASDVNAYHDASTAQIPMSNAGLPITHDTQLHSDHYQAYLTNDDIRSKWSQGTSVSPSDLAKVKNIDTLEHLFNYGKGAIRANGELKSLKSWPHLRANLEALKKTKRLSTIQEGYRDRLNNFFLQVDKPGGYQSFIDSTPEGARAAIKFSDRNAVIDSSVNFGDPNTTARVRIEQHTDSLNEWVRERNAIGIGADFPDDMRQPIPLQYLNPIASGFKVGGDVNAAIANIQVFDKKNRPYILNHFKNNPRQALTVLEIGNLGTDADEGFLAESLESQQSGELGEKDTRKTAQEKFFQLEKTGEHSDNKLVAKLAASLTDVNTYLRFQPKGNTLVSAKSDAGLRYIKDQASKANDYSFKNLDSYLQRYSSNMSRAYGVMTGFNYVTSKHDVPLEENEMQIFASHAQNIGRKKMLEYRTPAQVDEIFANRPPILVSSPGGRVELVFPDGSLVPDKNGHPAYSHLFTENLWRYAEADKGIIEYKEAEVIDKIPGYQLPGTPFISQQPKIPDEYLRAKLDKSTIVRPLIEGNINLENRPKVYDEHGNYETVKTITQEFDGKVVLLPTIVNGKELTPKQATEHYLKTGEHLGIFKTQAQADKYDEDMHRRMGWLGKKNKWGNK